MPMAHVASPPLWNNVWLCLTIWTFTACNDCRVPVTGAAYRQSQRSDSVHAHHYCPLTHTLSLNTQTLAMYHDSPAQWPQRFIISPPAVPHS